MGASSTDESICIDANIPVSQYENENKQVGLDLRKLPGAKPVLQVIALTHFLALP
jgi:hypothetical protein